MFQDFQATNQVKTIIMKWQVIRGALVELGQRMHLRQHLVRLKVARRNRLD